MLEGKEKKSRKTSKEKTKVNISPVKVATTLSSGKEKGGSTTSDIVVIVNGQKLEPEALKSFAFQWSDNLLVFDFNYELPKDAPIVKIKETNTDKGPSTKGISISETNDPEIYPLEDEGLLKLEVMSALRTNRKNDDDTPVSKLKAELVKKTKYETEEVTLDTGKFNITEVASMAAALNDLAVQEQKIQKDEKVIKVEEVLSPRIVILKNIFYLTEKLKIYKEKE